MLTVVVASAAATLKRIALTEPSVTAERASLFSAMSSASARITSATATPATKTKAHKSASPSAEVNLLLTLFVLCLMRSTSRHLSLSLLGLLLPYAPSLVQVHRDRCSWGKAGCIGQSGYKRIVASWRYLRSVCLRRIERCSYPLYVARGRRIGCEGATDRLPHGPSSAQRPLNSEGRRAPLTDREPEQLPGTPAKPASPHWQGRATTNGGEQADDGNTHLLCGHRRGQGPLGRGAPAERGLRASYQRRAGHPLGGAPSA